MSLLQKWPELAAVPIAQHDQGSNQVRTVFGPARLRAVARDALGGPHVPAAVGRGCIDRRPIGWPHALAGLGQRLSPEERGQGEE
jgi:hypothetical protein